MDLYAVLDLPRTATQDDIKKRHRELVMKYHPDRNPGDAEASEKFKQVQEAYDNLGDEQKRAFYDQNGVVQGTRSAPPRPPAPNNFFHSVFSNFFGGEANARGRHVQVRLELDLEEALKESTHSITYSKRKICKKCRGCGASSFQDCSRCLGSGQVAQNQNPPFIFTSTCPNCQGMGRLNIVRCDECAGTGYGVLNDCKLDVKIPAGIDNGMQVRVRGAGEDGTEGEPAGDLFIVVLFKPHDFFKREGINLVTEVPISYSTLVLGGAVSIPTLDGGFMSVKVPPGTQNSTRFRLKGRGMPDPRVQNNVGDILASVRLDVPSDLDDAYKEILAKLKEAEMKSPSPKVKEYAERVS